MNSLFSSLFRLEQGSSEKICYKSLTSLFSYSPIPFYWYVHPAPETAFPRSFGQACPRPPCSTHKSFQHSIFPYPKHRQHCHGQVSEGPLAPRVTQSALVWAYSQLHHQLSTLIWLCVGCLFGHSCPQLYSSSWHECLLFLYPLTYYPLKVVRMSQCTPTTKIICQ
jgi:hypothetical protein